MSQTLEQAIKAGDPIPDVTVHTMGDGGPEEVSVRALCSGKKVVMFGVPGAFTPTCSESHLPGFVSDAKKILDKGVDQIVCISVNDVFVMDAWGKQSGSSNIMMLADGLGAFAHAVGMTLDFTARGLGIRSDRYAMIVDDGTVSWVAREEPKTLDVSTAEAVLKVLEG